MSQPVPGKQFHLCVVSDHEFDPILAITYGAKSPGGISGALSPFIEGVKVLSNPKAALTGGYEQELPPFGIKNIKDMVRLVIRICDSGRAKVSTLEIIGHGNEDLMEVGSDLLGTVVDAFTRAKTLSLKAYSADLIRLRPYFAANAKVKLGGCKIGANERLIIELSKLWPGVTVIGMTANQRPLVPGDEGGIRVCKDSRCVYSGPGAFDYLDRLLGL